jgi:hypothetical protein
VREEQRGKWLAARASAPPPSPMDERQGVYGEGQGDSPLTP